jgi:hypothetical protein
MEKLNKLYAKQGYLDKYNGSVFMMFIIFLVFFLAISFFLVKTQIIPIRNNWNNQRCSPMVIPFAGIINPPLNKSAFDFTYENFNYCINNIITDVVKIATEPIRGFLNIFSKFISGLKDVINDIRKVIDVIRTGVGDVSRDIMERLLSVLIPIQKLIIKVKDIMSKSHAVMVSGMYTGVGVYFTILSALGNIYDLLMALLVAMSALLVGLWLDPFTWDEAAMYTVVYGMAAVPIGILGESINIIMSMAGDSHCFKKGTLIRAQDRTLYSIETIPLGTKLYNGGYVTASLKLDAKGQQMYRLGNITVSGGHTVYFSGKWIKVSEHPNAKKIDNFTDKEIYCLNTSSKKIHIDDFIFQDWDEIDDKKLEKLGCKNGSEIYDKYENGFDPDTQITLNSGNKIELSNLGIGDILENGEKVTGIVEIYNRKSTYAFEFFNGTQGLSNIQYLGKERPILSEQKPSKLFHILTNTGSFNLSNLRIHHYNANIDFFL